MRYTVVSVEESLAVQHTKCLSWNREASGAARGEIFRGKNWTYIDDHFRNKH